MKNLIDWAVNTIGSLPAAQNYEDMKLESRIVLFTSLSILLDHKAEAENLPQVVKDPWSIILKCDDEKYLNSFRSARFYAGACNFNYRTGVAIYGFLPDNRHLHDYNLSRTFRKYCSMSPESSGSHNYPVKHPGFEGKNVEQAHDIYIDHWDHDKNMWGADPYGQNRWAMVEFVHNLVGEDLKNADFNV